MKGPLRLKVLQDADILCAQHLGVASLSESLATPLLGFEPVEFLRLKLRLITAGGNLFSKFSGSSSCLAIKCTGPLAQVWSIQRHPD